MMVTIKKTTTFSQECRGTYSLFSTAYGLVFLDNFLWRLILNYYLLRVIRGKLTYFYQLDKLYPDTSYTMTPGQGSFP